MRLLSSLAIVATLACGAACSALVGFQDFERVDHIGPDDEAGAAEAGDVGPAPPPTTDPDADAAAEAGVDGSSPDGAIPPASKTCPAPAPLTYPTWVSPPARAKPCTPADIQTFVNNESRPFDMQKAAMAATNAACAACVFTSEDDAVWGPIVHTKDDRIFDAFGLCYRVAGASDDCGAKDQELEWCIQKICNVCVDGQTLNDCRAAVEAGTCKTRFDAVVSGCSDFGTIVNTTCAGSGNVVGVLCGGT